MNEETYRPLNDDILMYLKPIHEVIGSSIVFQESNDSNVQYFNVFATGPKCRDVKVGDVVVLPWTRVTVPQKLFVHGELRDVGVTSEKEVLAILEN